MNANKHEFRKRASQFSELAALSAVRTLISRRMRNANIILLSRFREPTDRNCGIRRMARPLRIGVYWRPFAVNLFSNAFVKEPGKIKTMPYNHTSELATDESLENWRDARRRDAATESGEEFADLIRGY